MYPHRTLFLNISLASAIRGSFLDKKCQTRGKITTIKNPMSRVTHA